MARIEELEASLWAFCSRSTATRSHTARTTAARRTFATTLSRVSRTGSHSSGTRRSRIRSSSAGTHW